MLCKCTKHSPPYKCVFVLYNKHLGQLDNNSRRIHIMSYVPVDCSCGIRFGVLVVFCPFYWCMYLSLSVFERTAEAPVPHDLKGQVSIDGQVNQSAFISVSWKVGILLHIIKKLYVCLGSLPHTQVTSACMCVYTHVWVCVCLFLRMHVYCTSTVRMRVCVYCKYCSACLFA